MNLRNIIRTNPLLSQQARLKLDSGNPSMTVERDIAFTTVHAASLRRVYTHEVGTGTFDVSALQRIMYYTVQEQNAALDAEDRVSIASVTAEFRNFVFSFMRSTKVTTDMVGFVTGRTATSHFDGRRLARLPAESIAARVAANVKKEWKGDYTELFTLIASEYFTRVFNELGMVMESVTSVYRVENRCVSPTFNEYVDTMYALEFRSMLEALSNFDFKAIKSALESKDTSFTVAQVANRIGQNVTVAHDQMRNSINPERAVRSIFASLYAMWNPNVPKEMLPPDTIVANPIFSSLVSNYTMFAAVQEYLTEHDMVTNDFGTLDFRELVLPQFAKAIQECSPFSEVSIADASATLGKRSVIDYDKYVTHMVLTEAWKAASDVQAFVPVRHEVGNPGRYLMPEHHVTDILQDAYRPIDDIFSIDRVVDSYLNAVRAAPDGFFTNLKKDAGTEIRMAIPSVGAASSLTLSTLSDEEIGVIAGLNRSDREKYLKDDLKLQSRLGTVAVSDDAEGQVTRKPAETLDNAIRIICADVDAAQRDLYSRLVCLAIRHAPSTRVGVVASSSEDRLDTLVLRWDAHANGVQPHGHAAITARIVKSIEPLEVLTYVEDFQSTGVYQHEDISLSQFDRNLHMWDWRRQAAPVRYQNTHNTKVAGHSISVDIDEVVALALGSRRNRLQMIVPQSASYIARMWVSWFTATKAEFTTLTKSKDDNVSAAAAGMLMQIDVAMAIDVMHIANSTIGGNLRSHLDRSVSNHLYGKGELDAMRDVHIPARRTIQQLYVGAIIMDMMNVLPSSQLAPLVQILSDRHVLTTLIAAHRMKD